MVDPDSVVTEIVTVAQLIIRAASTVKQNKVKCLELADLAHTMSHASLAHANNTATVRVLERLRDAVDEALRLVCSCQSAGKFSGSGGKKADELASVENRINNCIMYITFIRTGTPTAHVGVPFPAAPAPYYPAAPAPYYPAAPAPYPAAPAPYYPAAPAPYYPAAPAPYPAAPAPYHPAAPAPYPAAPAPYYPAAPAPYPAAPAPYPCYSAPPDPSGFKL